jgi:hypothetical protein
MDVLDGERSYEIELGSSAFLASCFNCPSVVRLKGIFLLQFSLGLLRASVVCEVFVVPFGSREFRDPNRCRIHEGLMRRIRPTWLILSYLQVPC